MGCHTWFCRPVTEDEFQKMKDYAPTEIYDLIGNSEENDKYGLYDKALYKSLMRSYKENIPCVSGKYWWQLGWGEGAIEDFFVHKVRGYRTLFVDVLDYTDTFRVKNYPTKVITSRRNLRKWMRKKYFALTNEQLEKISEFFRKYPDGVIMFG